MKLAYQVATPDVRLAPSVTSYQGDLETSFKRLSEAGYAGAELMVRDPAAVDVSLVIQLSEKYHLSIPMVCTGEVFGQDQLSFSSLDDGIRAEAIKRAKDAVDLAKQLNALMSIGRLRGGFAFMAPPDECRKRSMDGLSEVGNYALQQGVIVTLEPVNSIAINFINTTQQGIEALREINCPALRLMLDSNHMFIDDQDLFQSVADARNDVAYVHLADSNRLYPGNCKLDFKKFIESLKNISYTGWLSVEVFQRPDQDTALLKSFKHISPLL